MSVSIRLSRVGAKKEARYRIVAATKRSRRDGESLEVLGSYFPLLSESKQVVLDKQKYTAWKEKGAVPSRTVASLVKRLS